jgi:hypothetical protein
MYPSHKKMAAEELNKFLEIMVGKLLEKKPELAKNKDLLVQQVTQLLNMKFDQNPNNLNKNLIRQPDFLKQAALCMMLSAELQQNPKLSKELDAGLQKLLKNDKFMADFKQMMKDPSIKNAKDLSKRMDVLLEKHLGKEDASLLKTAMKELTKLFDKTKSNTDAKKDSKANDKNKEANKESMRDEDPNIHLTSLLCNQTGSMEVPVQVQIGNLFNVPDQDPYHGDAFLNRVNDVSSSHGDYQGTQNSTKENFDSIDSTVTGMLEAINNESMLNPNTPKLNHR